MRLTRAVEIWRGGQQGMAERLEGANRLDASELAEGLGLDLEEIWAVGERRSDHGC